MNTFRRPAVFEQRGDGAVLPVYLGLYLVLLAFFVYFVAIGAERRPTQAAVAEDAAAIAQPPAAMGEAVPAPALRPLAELFRPLALPAQSGEPGEPLRLDAAVSPERIFLGDTPSPRPDFAPVLDGTARALSLPSAAASTDPFNRATADETLALQLLVGLPAADNLDPESPSVAAILAERLAIARAAALARALLVRGTPPERFAVGVAPGSGQVVRFLFRLDHRHATSLSRG